MSRARHKAAKRKNAEQGAAHALHKADRADSTAAMAARYGDVYARNERCEFNWSSLLPQPLEQGGHVHLIGLVVACQHIHHDVHAGSVGMFALQRVRRNCRKERNVVFIKRPGAGKVVARDDDGRHAVAAAGRSVTLGVVSESRMASTHKRAASVSARKITEDVEGLGEHMIRRHRFQRRNVDIGKDRAKPCGFRRYNAIAAEPGKSVPRVETAPCRPIS